MRYERPRIEELRISIGTAPPNMDTNISIKYIIDNKFTEVYFNIYVTVKITLIPVTVASAGR